MWKISYLYHKVHSFFVLCRSTSSCAYSVEHINSVYPQTQLVVQDVPHVLRNNAPNM